MKSNKNELEYEEILVDNDKQIIYEKDEKIHTLSKRHLYDVKTFNEPIIEENPKNKGKIKNLC